MKDKVNIPPFLPGDRVVCVDNNKARVDYALKWLQGRGLDYFFPGGYVEYEETYTVRAIELVPERNDWIVLVEEIKNPPHKIFGNEEPGWSAKMFRPIQQFPPLKLSEIQKVEVEEPLTAN